MRATDRRAFLRLAGYSAGAFAVLGLGSVARAGVPVRPPGAVNEDDFLALCVRCGKCVSVCPTGALRHATLAEGIPAVGTPVLVQDCILCMDCTQICDTGALRRIKKSEARMGRAVVDPARCTGCGKCLEPCRFRALTAHGKEPVTVDPERCVGCGACLPPCPETPRAIRLTPEGAIRP